MAHTGQPTLLCHQTLGLRAFKGVVVDSVLTWPLSTCMPTQCPCRFQFAQAATWEAAEENDLTLTAFGPQGSYFTSFCYQNLWACHSTPLWNGGNNNFFTLRPAFIFWIIRWLLVSMCPNVLNLILLHAYRPKSTPHFTTQAMTKLTNQFNLSIFKGFKK